MSRLTQDTTIATAQAPQELACAPTSFEARLPKECRGKGLEALLERATHLAREIGCRTRFAPEDVAQETLLRLMRTETGFTEPRSLYAYLRVVVEHTVADLIRRDEASCRSWRRTVGLPEPEFHEQDFDCESLWPEKASDPAFLTEDDLTGVEFGELIGRGAGGKGPLTELEADCVARLLTDPSISRNELAAQMGLSRSSLWRIRTGLAEYFGSLYRRD